MTHPEEMDESDWPRNYFNYFTEIEEHFQKARGTGLFLMSPLDWALIENWKNSGIPLEAVLKGIDDAFEKWRSRKQKRRLVNSLAYCTQAVMDAAQRTPAGREHAGKTGAIPFTREEVDCHLKQAVTAMRQKPEPAFANIASAVEEVLMHLDEYLTNLEDLERRLTTWEEKLVSILRALQSDEDLYSLRENLDRELKPYRGKMTAEQLSMLERRYLDTALLQRAQLPRLSLFYIR
jgi:hypothetical protein